MGRGGSHQDVVVTPTMQGVASEPDGGVYFDSVSYSASGACMYDDSCNCAITGGGD